MSVQRGDAVSGVRGSGPGISSEQPGGNEPLLNLPTGHGTSVLAGLTVEQRIILARKAMGDGAADNPLDADALAHKLILQIIVQDAEVRVRQALAETLAERPTAPHDVVLALAMDVDLVASPVLSLSEVLTPEDLVEIINTVDSSDKLAAIARRRDVPSTVCLALIDKGDEETADQLLRNSGADIPEIGMHRIIDRHGDREKIQVGLVGRTALPATVIERVVAVISSELITRLVERHRLPMKVAATLALETRDRATHGLASGLPPEAMNKLVSQLFEEHRLTQSLLLWSICTGNLEFIIHALAAGAMVSTDYVRRLVAEAIPGELDELWNRADLPAKLLPFTKAAIEVQFQTQLDGAKWDVAYFRQRIIERTIMRSNDFAIEFSDEDIEFLIEASGHAGVKLQDFIPDHRAAVGSELQDR